MLALVLVVVAQAEIEVPATVAPLSRLLPELGQRANMKLVAGTKVRDDVVGIASPQRPVRELMDGIAEAVNASWVEDNGTWVLTRTKQHEDADQKRETNYRREGIARSLSVAKHAEPFTELHAVSLVERRKAYYAQDQEPTGGYELHQQSPVGRYGFRILKAIGAEALAEIPAWRTVVFSSRPTARQRALPKAVTSDLFGDFVREQTLYFNATSRDDDSIPSGGPYGFDFAWKAPTAIDKVLLVVTAQPFGNIRPQLILADKNGKVVLMAPIEVRRDTTPLFESLEKVADEPIVHEGWIRDYWNKTPTSPEILTRLRRPAENEPHGLYMQGVIRLWSRLKERPVVALMPDLMPQAVPGNAELKFRAAQLAVRMRCAVDETSSRVVIRPHEPVLSRRMRTDRVALQTLLTKPGPRPTVESMIDLMAKNDTNQMFLINRYAEVVKVPELRGFPSLDLLRLVALGRRGDATFGQMNEAQRDFARYWVYERRAGFRHIDSLDSEPTEAFPVDLPADARLTVKFEVAVGAATHLPWDVYRPGNMEPLVLGQRLDDVTFKLGEFRNFHFRFALNDKIAHDLYVSDTLRLEPEPVPYAKLPAEYRAKLDQWIADGKRLYGLPPR